MRLNPLFTLNREGWVNGFHPYCCFVLFFLLAVTEIHSAKEILFLSDSFGCPKFLSLIVSNLCFRDGRVVIFKRYATI